MESINRALLAAAKGQGSEWLVVAAGGRIVRASKDRKILARFATHVPEWRVVSVEEYERKYN
ncbi:MAG: hypothetical protein II859_10155 [Bacteroidales bacterium]|nr:hypothetical protein [Bacteroidales bacterium]